MISFREAYKTVFTIGIEPASPRRSKQARHNTGLSDSRMHCMSNGRDEKSPPFALSSTPASTIQGLSFVNAEGLIKVSGGVCEKRYPRPFHENTPLPMNPGLSAAILVAPNSILNCRVRSLFAISV